MNQYQQESLDILKEKLEQNSDLENQCLQEKIQYLIKTILDLKLIEKYDLLEDDITVEKVSDNSIAIYFSLHRNTKLVVIIDEIKYHILYKRSMKEDWQSKYVDNMTELQYIIEEFL